MPASGPLPHTLPPGAVSTPDGGGLDGRFDNSFARELEGLYQPWQAARVAAPQLLWLNAELAQQLGLDAAALQGQSGAQLFSGQRLPAGAQPLAQAYAGHQFGGFSPQLGDGRALLLGEVIDRGGRRRDLAFKGSGPTPFARGGDGKAALGPVLREALLGEAMHALGVPTTRALAVVATGEPVFRERALPGAVLTRVAASHLRVGSFEYFAARGQRGALRRLAEHAIARHDPELRGRQDRCLGLLAGVAQRQARLLAQWMNLGFIHGVMNTDNMTLSGETIDYGPCAFLDAYDPAAVFSSIDHGGRYAFGQQPRVARWNLARLAEALLPLLAEEAGAALGAGAGEDAVAAADPGTHRQGAAKAEANRHAGPDPDTNPDADPFGTPIPNAAIEAAVARAMPVIDGFSAKFDAAWRAGQRAKLGLQQARADDAALADDWLDLLHAQRADFTLAWRHLADAAEGHEQPLRGLLAEPAAADAWLGRWRARLASEPTAPAARAAAMRRVSPWLIARNQRVEQALAAAVDEGDLAPFEQLLAALRQPFDFNAAAAALAEPAAADWTARYQTFCGT